VASKKHTREGTTMTSLPDAVITNGVFSFLDQSEHVRFGRTSKAFLRLAGLPCPVVSQPDAWKNKLFRLPITTTDEELARFCAYARPTWLSLAGCTRLTDNGIGYVAPMLRFLTELNLSGCDLVDVSALGGVHTLNLSGCRGLTDVSALGGVTKLYTQSKNENWTPLLEPGQRGGGPAVD
jgi:hypothetical protein